MKRIFSTYRELIGIIFKQSPMVVVAVLAVAIIGGALTPFSTWVNAQMLNGAVEVANGADFSKLTPFLALFIAAALLPNLIICSYGSMPSRAVS
jgi:hypothetical protein